MKCRICGNPQLRPVLHLGEQALTGVFPSTRDERITTGPLELVKCWRGDGSAVCGLLQLRYSYDGAEMYGTNYGYRSGLNSSMVAHLESRVEQLRSRISLNRGDLVVDIGSNDGTLLSFYPRDLQLVGIDPTGIKLKQYYPRHVDLLPTFFSARVLQSYTSRKARVVTSFSMFYDLEDPLGFVGEVRDILADDGVWMIEQSYMPAMLRANAFDTVCHEHLEFYDLSQVQWMADRAGLEVLDVDFNNVNGGSFSVLLAKPGAGYTRSSRVDEALARERAEGLNTLAPYEAFARRVKRFRDDLDELLHGFQHQGRLVAGYGASTKGNVLLQYCNITAHQVPCIGEINADKYGRFTPGTLIPIVSEAEAKALAPDYLLVLPWHFRDYFVEREASYFRQGGRLLFPLPNIALVPPLSEVPAHHRALRTLTPAT
ncbi:MAG: class I SAM-dependent methyltransferase [Bryobacterales bacterium]|nr:class I SAM-dependent methyltransferase [Bryobacterales bacterium]